MNAEGRVAVSLTRSIRRLRVMAALVLDVCHMEARLQGEGKG